MPHIFTSKTQKFGEIGEDIACRFLMKQGYSVIDRNVTRKWGEIDIIATKGKNLHFIEVKAVNREILSNGVTHVTTDKGYNPAENLHFKKQYRIVRTIEGYLLEKRIKDTEWQLDLACVFLDIKNKKAKVELLENIIVS